MVNDLKERKQIPKNAADDQHLLTLPIYGKMLLQDEIINVLLPKTLPPGVEDPRIIHIDISHEVCNFCIQNSSKRIFINMVVLHLIITA